MQGRRISFSKKALNSNFRFHNACEQYGIGSCKVPEVYKSACQIFPIHLIKTIRLPFEEANTILMDPEIGNKLKIIFLLRDPRGVHQSVESIVNWCNECSVSNNIYLCNTTMGAVGTNGEFC